MKRIRFLDRKKTTQEKLLFLSRKAYPSINYDKEGDVLYVKMQRARIAYSEECKDDSFVVVNYNEQGRAVGLILLAVMELGGSKHWQDYRQDIPSDLFLPVLFWLEEQEQST